MWNCEGEGRRKPKKKNADENIDSRDLLMATHPTADLPIWRLYMPEQTG
jgi:hypothetical protein